MRIEVAEHPAFVHGLEDIRYHRRHQAERIYVLIKLKKKKIRRADIMKIFHLVARRQKLGQL